VGVGAERPIDGTVEHVHRGPGRGRPPTVRAVTWKRRAERGHRVRSDAVAPREGGHYVPDGTVHAVDDQTGEVACGFDGELIAIEAAWDSPAFASVKCADCEQELTRRTRVC
jgi:hypothetical protein